MSLIVDRVIREQAIGLPHLTVAKINFLLRKSPPLALKSSERPLDKANKEAFDALVFLGCSYSYRRDASAISDSFSTMWSVVCAWGFIFLRDIVLSEIHTEEEEVLRDRMTCAIAGLFRLNVNLRLVSLHDRVVTSIPEFLAVSLEVQLRLLDTNHPAFGHWAHFYFTFCDVIKIRETWNARAYQRVCERLATQSQAGGRKYDISGLCIRRFNEEAYKDEKDFDTQGFHAVMMCWMVFGQSSETVMRRLLARGAIPLLVKATRRFSRLALKRKQEKWDDALWYFQFANSIVDCEDFLLVAVGKGQTWITEALDAKMLRALASIPATLERRYSNIPIGRQTEGILDLLKPFVLYRSVLNSVLGDWKRMRREGMTSAIEVVDKAMRGVVKHAEEIKDVYRAFETMTPSLSVHCSNHNVSSFRLSSVWDAKTRSKSSVQSATMIHWTLCG
ncbi:hypothetical protein AAF712_014443 [Marasmius tenuissimus]|uniref:Uncharacterized protein n=1 Tax=Marasmius tenuissimus TaxID=585030 RepID=A0ABR2ZB29_9AGAR